jgi:hypothetical protein
MRIALSSLNISLVELLAVGFLPPLSDSLRVELDGSSAALLTAEAVALLGRVALASFNSDQRTISVGAPLLTLSTNGAKKLP